MDLSLLFGIEVLMALSEGFIYLCLLSSDLLATNGLLMDSHYHEDVGHFLPFLWVLNKDVLGDDR